jgi:hypothetical protein
VKKLVTIPIVAAVLIVGLVVPTQAFELGFDRGSLARSLLRPERPERAERPERPALNGIFDTDSLRHRERRIPRFPSFDGGIFTGGSSNARRTGLASLSVSPLALSPGFSTTTTDYTVPCVAGVNTLEIRTRANAGGEAGLTAPITTEPSRSQTNTVQLLENQAAVVHASDSRGNATEYWIRCLPHDFPAIDATPHRDAGTPTPGWYLTQNFPNAVTASYAIILDTNGTPVWYKRSPRQTATDVKPWGKNHVAFADSDPGDGGYAQDPTNDYDVWNLETNQIVEQIKGVGVPTDFHDMVALPNGNRLIMAYPLRSGFDLTGLTVNQAPSPPPGPVSTIADCEIQEVDPQGALVWQWKASEHVHHVTENQFTPPPITLKNTPVYDVYHCNSIEATPEGDVIVSLRHNNAVIRIRRSDGEVIWKLGGTANNLDNAQHLSIQNYPQNTLSLQHDARLLPNGNISAFDNQGGGPGPAQGVEFALDFANGTAEPVFQIGSPEGKRSLATGSFRRYSDGSNVANWGITSFTGPNTLSFTEFDDDGNNVLDVAFATGNGAYRTVKSPLDQYDLSVLRATAGQ